MTNIKLTRRDGLVCLILALVTVAIYWQLRTAHFVIYDDDDYVTDNLHVQAGLTWKGVAWAFTSGEAANWHPLTWLSHMLDCQLFGLDAGKHHLVNVLFHVANSLLLFVLLRFMTGAFWRCALVAALFAWHPVHVESVAWVAERKDVLSTFFWMLTLLAYTAYARRPAKSRYAAVLVLFALALLAKPMVVTLPCLMLLLDYWPLRRVVLGKPDKNSNPQPLPWPRLVLEKLPLFALSAISCFVTYSVQSAQGVTAVAGIISPGLRIANSLISYTRYLGKIFWPANLAVFYPYDKSPPAWQVLGAATLITAITWAAVYFRRQRPYFIVGWLWFLGTLVPAIGLIQVGTQSMADRYTYVPALGIFIALVWSVAALPVSKPQISLLVETVAVLALTGLIAVASVQVGYWQNWKTLFEHALNVTKNNAVAEYTLGYGYQEENNFNEALRYYHESLRLDPHKFAAHNNAGMCFAALGKYTEAINEYAQVLGSYPKNPAAHLNLGLSLEAMGNPQGALAEYSAASALEPANPKPRYAAGACLLAQGNFVEAKTELSEVVRLNPNDGFGQMKLASALSSLGDIDGAIEHYEAAVHNPLMRTNPAAFEAFNNLAWIRAANARPELRNGAEAVSLARQACEITTNSEPFLLGTLAAAYAEAGQFQEAEATARKARELAIARGLGAVAAKNKELLKLYQSKRAYHESPPFGQLNPP